MNPVDPGWGPHAPMPTLVWRTSHPWCALAPRVQHGEAPIHYACSQGHEGVVQILVDAKAKIDLQSNVTRGEGWEGVGVGGS